MLERPLVPLDSAAVAEQVLPYVTLLAKVLHQPLELVSVVPDEKELDHVSSVHQAAIVELMQGRRAYAERYLETVRPRLVADGVDISTTVLAGDVTENILAAASASHAEVIAMTTHGRGGPERWFLGSVADKVVRASPVPVLLVRPGADEPQPPVAIREILLPLDGSSPAEAAVPYAAFLALAFKVPITVIRTISMSWSSVGGADMFGTSIAPEIMTTLQSDAEQYVERIAIQLRTQGIETTTVCRMFTVPDVEIEQRAASTPGAFVVMTSHGRSGIGRALLGNVADRVIRSLLAPVLVVRMPSS